MSDLVQLLKKHQGEFHKVVDFNPSKDQLTKMDFTEANTELAGMNFSDTTLFSKYIEDHLHATGSKYGIGGYDENRTLYRRSPLFDGAEPRTIHLGTDIWGAEGSSVYAPLGGTVHSFAFNNTFGDYGATLILQHQLDTTVFFTLYGHLSKNDLVPLKEGNYIIRGDVIGHFGKPEENGNWPPHLHLQVIKDMRIRKGDYPGVSTKSEREKYLANCPDADLVLGMMKYAV